MSVRIAAGGDAGEAITRVVPQLVAQRVASGIAAQDPDLWGEGAAAGASRRLGWTESVSNSRPLVGDIADLRERFRRAAVDRVVLCTSGTASLATQVIAATQHVPLTVLDSADPDAVRRALGGRLEATAVVVVSRSETTPETDAHLAVFEQAFHDAGVDPAERVIVVTDPGGPLDEAARAAGHHVFHGPADLGPRFEALTAFGLVPAGLAGADVAQVLDEAESELLDLAIDAPTNNALVLAAAIAGAGPRGGALVLVADGTHLVGFGDWVEQLVAGSLGRAGIGLLPVVVEVGAPELDAPARGVQVVRFVDDATDGRHDDRLRAGELLLSGTLGELLLVWEHAVAVAGRLMGVDPFADPDLEAVAARMRELLAAGAAPAAPVAPEGGVVFHRYGATHGDSADLGAAVGALLAAIPDDGYLAVLADVDAAAHPDLRAVRDLLARRTGRPVTFGRGPGHLWSTGQFHRGGPATGVHLVVTAVHGDDLEVPGRSWSLADLVAARSRAGAEDLAARGRPVLHVHLAGDQGTATLLAAVAR